MNKVFRSLIVLVAISLAGVSLYPTLWWYMFADAEQKQFISLPAAELRDVIKKDVAADMERFVDLSSKNTTDFPAELTYIVDVAKDYRSQNKLEKPDAWTPRTVAALFPDRQSMIFALEENLLADALGKRELKDAALRLGLDLNGGYQVTVEPEEESLQRKIDELAAREDESRERDDLEQLILMQTVDALSQRIDRFGLTEPELRVFDNNRALQIALPGQGGEVGSSAVSGFLQAKGSLNFHLMDQDATRDLATYLRENPAEESKISEQGSLPDYELPDGYYIVPLYSKDRYGLDLRQGYGVLERSPLLKGEDITEARADRNQNDASWEVIYSLNASGSADLRRIFSDYAGDYMAIVQDNRIVSYPRIQEVSDPATVSRGGRITGSFTQEEASTLAKVLNSGNLPVDLEVTSQQSVAALLGRATVQLGLIAVLVGFLLIIIFMLSYYRNAGFNACVALLLNLLFLLALLALMNTTLTMTSIVSIILTVGMSVDANVIIFERIKEELRAGKSRAAAIKLGFSRAFWTIIDANITTGIAAVFLSALGEGAIRGFAVTLAWGIVCSLFTAIFISHLLFDIATDLKKNDKIAISWRRLTV